MGQLRPARRAAAPRVALTAALAASAACGGGADRPAPPPPAAPAADPVPNAAAPAAPGRVVDSILPMAEQLRRFRADLGPAPAALAGGAASREALVRAYARAVEARDTVALRRMVLSRAEFAFLYFPESPLARRPYEVPPALLWFQITEGSNKGVVRALRRLGGRPLGYAGHACEGPPKPEGPNRLWERCRVRVVRAPGDTAALRLFGSVLERGGRYKFVGYANDF
jgi:hypothetical protein